MKPCTIEIEDVNEPRGVRGVVRVDGNILCATRVFPSAYPFCADASKRAHERAVDMAEGLGYAVPKPKIRLTESERKVVLMIRHEAEVRGDREIVDATVKALAGDPDAVRSLGFGGRS